MFRNIGTTEIIILAVVILVLFGPKKLPELARGIAQSLKEFKSVFESEKKKDENKE